MKKIILILLLFISQFTFSQNSNNSFEENRIQQLKNNIAALGVSDADTVIARTILSLIQENK